MDMQINNSRVKRNAVFSHLATWLTTGAKLVGPYS